MLKVISKEGFALSRFKFLRRMRNVRISHSQYNIRYIIYNKDDSPVDSSKTANSEDTVEINDHGDGEGLFHHLRDDRLASPRSHHLDRGERDISEWQGQI